MTFHLGCSQSPRWEGAGAPILVPSDEALCGIPGTVPVPCLSREGLRTRMRDSGTVKSGALAYGKGACVGGGGLHVSLAALEVTPRVPTPRPCRTHRKMSDYHGYFPCTNSLGLIVKNDFYI